MSVWDDILDLFVRGGLEIVTTEPAGPQGERGHSIRTLVMRDADVITWVEPAEDYTALWAQHQQSVQQKMRSIRLFRWSLRYGVFVLLSGAFILSNVSNFINQQLLPMLISLVVSVVAAFLIRLGVSLTVRLLIRRQLEKYLAPLRNL
jgi:hypothetical protein